MLIDVNCALGRWPFQRSESLTPDALEAHLAAEGVQRALVYSLDAVLAPDVAHCNRQLLEALRSSATLRPVPTVDPSMPAWRETLAACRDTGWLGAVRVVPNYHLYRLDDPTVDALAEALTQADATLAIQVRVEDERGQYPMLKMPGVPADDIAALARRHPTLRILCLCCYLPEARRLAAASANLFVETSFIECLDTLRYATEVIPAQQLAFGTYTPVFYTRANRMKLTSAEVSAEVREQVAWQTAARLFPRL